MPDVLRLNSFSVGRAWSQAASLHELVNRNRDWLETSDYAGALSRYGRPVARATLQVARMASTHELVHPYIISVPVDPEKDRASDDWRVSGLATLIRGQTVQDQLPNIEASEVPKLIHGVDIDYWLDEQTALERPNLHESVAKALMKEAKYRLHKLEDATTMTAFATIVPDALHQPVGFQRVMYARGFPQLLQVVGGDPYDIAKGGQSLQLYAHTEPIGRLDIPL